MIQKPLNKEDSNLNWQSAVGLFEKIESTFEKKPPKKNKSDYESWKKEINEYIYQCNKICKSKIYELVK